MRAAEALLALGERSTVRMAIEEYEAALKIEPTNRKYQEAYERITMIWESDYA